MPGAGLGTRDTVVKKVESLPSGEHIPVKETEENKHHNAMSPKHQDDVSGSDG